MKKTTNREQDRLLRKAMERSESDADSVQGDLDDLLREAMGRRAERVPALSADFQERVMTRLRPLSVSLRKEEDRGSRRRRWVTLAWVGNIAAAVVVGWFVFFGHDGLNRPDEGTANDSALVQEAIGTSSYTDVSLAQEAMVTQLPAPPLKGAGSQLRSSAAIGASRSGSRLRSSADIGSQTLASDMSAFYASMEEIERLALREANTMTGEALGQACGATSPS